MAGTALGASHQSRLPPLPFGKLITGKSLVPDTVRRVTGTALASGANELPRLPLVLALDAADEAFQ